jgi:tellurite methyltransferase
MSKSPDMPSGTEPTTSTPVKKAMDFAAEKDWPGYYKVVLGKPPRETLVFALDLFDKERDWAADPAPRTAIDLGCGEGRDTLELLRRGWHVVATDAHPDALSHLLARVPRDQAERLETRTVEFRSTRLPRADLVNASFALPFCGPGDFPVVWEEISRAISPGGRFAGQLFGDRDDWAGLPDRTHQTRPQVIELFRGFEFEMLKEEEKDDATATGGSKHWHVFHIVARRQGGVIGGRP